MTKKTMYFISGVSGVGKTSVISHLQEIVPQDFEIHDFDERGVPTNAGHEWRITETRYRIETGIKKLEQTTGFVVCGFANPDEMEDMQKEFPVVDIKIILLDGDDLVIEQRLRNRNANKEVKDDLERVTGSAEAFIQNNTKFTPILRDMCKKHGCSIIDTTRMIPEKVAEELAKLIK